MEMNEVEKSFKSKGTVSKRFTIPVLLWEEWEQDCQNNFNDTYHLKMHFDHEFRKQFESLSDLLMDEIVELKGEVAALKQQINNEGEEERSKTFG